MKNCNYEEKPYSQWVEIDVRHEIEQQQIMKEFIEMENEKR